VISLCHEIPVSGHSGALETTELVSRDCYRPVMDTRVRKYVSGCKVCHRIKAPQHARHGTHMPLQAPSRPLESVTMDFITDWPGSTASGYTRILVIVERMTKMAMYLICRIDIDLPEVAQALL